MQGTYNKGDGYGCIYRDKEKGGHLRARVPSIHNSLPYHSQNNLDTMVH